MLIKCTLSLFMLVLLLTSRLDANEQLNPDEEEDDTLLDDMNEDESSGSMDEPSRTPALQIQHMVQSEVKNIAPKTSSRTPNFIEDNSDDLNSNFEDDNMNDFDNDNDNENNQYEDQALNNEELDSDLEDNGIEKPNNLNNEQVIGATSPSLIPYQSSRSKLINIITKPGILAGIVGGAIIGILTAILLIMFIVYRMRKKDEGSYALEETKKPLNAYDYRHCPTKEFYA